MATANEILQAEAIRHQLELQRYSNHAAMKMVALLNRSDADLMAQLQIAMDRVGGDWTVDRLESLLTQVRSINAAAYATTGHALSAELVQFSAYEAAKQIVMLTKAIPADALAQMALNSISGAQVHAAAMARPFQGRLLSEWMQGLESGRAQKIRDAVRIGFTESQTTEQIIRRIKGTRANNYADGLLEKPRADLETVVRSAVAHTAAFARNETAQANADIIASVDWLSTLDNKTSPPCIIRDGKHYTLDHKPIGHNIPWLAGPGNLHFNCRSTSTFTLKSAEQMRLNGLKPGSRASMNGQVAADVTYADWLKDQPASVQDDVLGTIRGRLYRKGKLPIERFVNNKGQMIDLKTLRERDAEAFRLAGL